MIHIDQDETLCLIRLEGEIEIEEATELKRLLLHGFGTSSKLCLDMGRVEKIDVTIMQLIHAAISEAKRTQTAMALRTSDAVEIALRNADFGPYTGTAAWID